MATTALCLIGAVSPHGQTVATQRPLLAEEVFKNVQVFKGVPVDEFMGSMGFFSNALTVNCTYCHVGEGGGGWAEYAKDIATKQTARRMVTMMNAINRTYFGGRRVVTCVSCHNGANRPKVSMSMAAVYGTTATDEPDEILKQAPGAPSAEQVLDKYIQAIGGTSAVATLTSLVGRGTHLGYGDADTRPMEIYLKAPNQRTTIIHTVNGDSTTTYDGLTGWIAAPDTDTPVPLRALAAAELEGAKLDVDLAFPARVKLSLTNWRGAVPVTIDDRDALVIQGTSAGRLPVKLYFDAETGLLVRLVRYTETPVGRNHTQIDYADYREIGGVKIPFRWILAWQSGRSTFELTDVQVNVQIEAAKFAKPALPGAPR